MLPLVWQLRLHVLAVDVQDAQDVPELPAQFEANLHVVSHLTDPTQSYPPAIRIMHIRYDYENRRASAEMLAGSETRKLYIRRYDMVQTRRKLTRT